MKLNWQLAVIAVCVLVFLVLLASGPHFGSIYRLPGAGGLGVH